MITCGTQTVSGAPVNGGGGGASLPDTPDAVLLDAANAGKAVGLASGTGEGAAVAFGDLVGAGIGEATDEGDEGDFLVGDGAGGSQLASAAAAAVRGVIGASALPTAGLDSARPAASLGALYTATDTGVRYLAESDGSGGSRWAVVGARGNEGRDTTAVRCAAGVTYGASSVTLAASSVASLAIVFAPQTTTTALGMLMSIKTGSTGWQLEIGRDSGDRSLLSIVRFGLSGSPATIGVTISAAPTAMHCLALTFSGTDVRASLDGGAVVVTSLGTGTLTDATQPWRINAQETASFIPDVDHTSAVIWSTSVGDSDLVTVSGAGHASGTTPGRIPAVAGATEIARWHAGWQRARLATEPLLAGSLGGSLTWSATPALVIR